jgi:hypothetical protein
LLITSIGLAASILLEFSQEWFPERVPSLMDVCAQCLGTLGGGIAWTPFGQQAIDWLRRWSKPLGTDQRLNNVLALAVVSHVLSLALPLDHTLRPSELWHKYQGGGILLRPFHNLVPQTPEAWLELPVLLGCSALAGWLWMRLQSDRG